MTSEIGIFKLKFIPIVSSLYNAFVYINNQDFKCKLSSYDTEVLAVQMRYGQSYDKVFYTSLGPFTPQISPGHIAMCPFLAKSLGIEEQDQILLALTTASAISIAHVYPKNDDDYSIMMSMHNILENSIMDQVRIIAPEQNISLKVGNISINLVTDSFKPAAQCGRLEKFTEFVVLTEKDKGPKEVEKENTVNSSFSQQLWNILSWGGGDKKKEQTNPSKTPDISSILKSALKKEAILDYRVVLDEFNSSGIIFTNIGFKTDTPVPCKLSKMPEKTALMGNSPKLNDYFIFGLVQSKVPENGNSLRQVFLNKEIMKKLDVVVGSRLYLEKVAALPTKELDTNKSGDVKDNNIKDAKEHPLKKIFKKPENSFLWQSLRELKDRLSKIVPESLKVKEGVNVIVTGPLGSGKTCLLETLDESFDAENLYCCFVSCKTLRGKKIESLLKILTAKWSECAYREPSVLFLDDIDTLMLQDEQEEADAGQGAIYSARLAALLLELGSSFQNGVSVVASASNLKYVTNAMSATRGPRLFDLVVAIPDLTSSEREQFLGFLGLEVNDEIISGTQGFRVQDLLDLSGRASLNAIVSEANVISLGNVEKALEETVPLSLHGVRLHKDVPYTWDDVGGMKMVKEVLDEIFRWPSQFPQVFGTCPLRIQSGALLFGPPGCGKTLVAGALANECGMNFISVKGPELLSKYVGASEAAVRDLFDRATRAQPCLLFFDELDSLAPRRGLDTTGVTDRVVNQLLTQLDGVESRTGVWILAASSRPDLVDPALLRPGRLDRVVPCSLPGPDDRENILRVLSRNLVLAEDVDLTSLAKATDNFSGADLQALLYNGQMKAIQVQTIDEENEELLIKQEHIKAALLETKPSLSLSELKKYDKLHKKMMQTQGINRDPEPPQPQKVTFM